MKAHYVRPIDRQRGATLLIALVLLVVMTLLGLSSIRSTSMQERMGANLYDRSLAFQAVESALREAEATISINTVVTNSNGLYCPPNGIPPSCAVPGPSATQSATSGSGGGTAPPEVVFVERWKDTGTQWTAASGWWNSVDSAMKARLGGTNRRPEYIIEYMGEAEDGTGCGRRNDTSCRGPRYRVTARMPEVDGLPNVILQTSYRP